LLAAPHQHALERCARIRVDLLVRHVRRHINEIALARLSDVLEAIAPRMRARPWTT
jgi:hypothetical protein